MAKVEVTMPKMGESITEGTVIAWHKQAGDRVELDETLLEIGTDKVDTDVPSPAEGIVKEIVIQEGETVDVGTVLAFIETDVEADEAAEPSEAPPADVEATAAGETPTIETPPASEPSAIARGEDAEAMANGETDQFGEEAEEIEDEVEPHLEVRPAGEGEVEVVMPKMGESITEGTVLAWHKKAGDTVELDETLLEIGTDKVDTEVPSPAAGIVKEILVQENETVDVGTRLAILTTEAEAGVAESEKTAPPSREKAAAPTSGKPAPAASEVKAERARVEAPSGDGAEVETELAGPAEIKRKGTDGRFYSPLVRSIAEKEGLSMQELESIGGSGREGRVTKEDVLRYVEQKEKRPAKEEKRVPEPQSMAEIVAEGDGHEVRVDVIKMDRMRQIIAEHMVRSKATSAHVTSFNEADVTNLVRLRERNKEAFEKREGVKLTYTPFFVQAAVESLREHPILNASVEGDKILIRKDLHVGIAVAIGKTGLVAPVIRSAGQKSLSGLAHAAADLAERARNKQLQPDELSGGTFTITNIGSLGSLMGTPIINQPQVAILAIGAIKKRPVVIEDPNLGDIIAVRHMVYFSLSYDHRIIDGAMGASFLQRFVQTLESIDPDEEL